MSDTQGTWKGSAPFGTGWNADVVEAVGSDLAINNGTIDVTAITADTLWGNPQTIAAKPTPVAIGPGLTLPATGTLAAQWQTGTVVSKVGSDLSVNSGTIDIAAITAASLFGNPGTAAAKPSAIAVGSGLTLSAVGTLSNTGILSLVGGTNVTITGGNTISATGGGGSGITSLVIGSGLSPAGTISAGGTTVSLGTIAASSLMGNPGTAGAVPGAIAVGTNLTLSAAGTLSASAPGTGTVTQVATSGAGIAGGPITGSGTLTVEWNGGTVNAVGPEFVEPSGTLHFDQMPTYISASATIDTTYFGKNVVDNSTGASDIVLTLTTLAATTHLTFNLQNNSAHHYVRLRPATGVTINGVPTSDFLLPNFTGGSVAVDSTGTAYTTGAALSFWNPSAGYVTGLNGLQITNDGTFSTNGTLTPVVDGSTIILSSGTLKSVASASFQTLTLQTEGASVGTGAAALGGNLVAFETTSTIAAVHGLLNSLVNGGSYISQIAALNGSNVVQSPISTSSTFVATDTANQSIKLSFSPSVVVSPGTNYAISLSRLDGGNTFVLPTVGIGSGSLWAPKLKGVSNQIVAASTVMSVGQTLTVAAAPRTMGFDIL